MGACHDNGRERLSQEYRNEEDTMKISAIALAFLIPFAFSATCEQAEPLVRLECTETPRRLH